MASIVNTIPASTIVQVVPGVLSAGGSNLELNGLFITTNTRVPYNQVLSFPTATSVAQYFGGASAEYAQAQIYFGGFTGATALPGAMLFAQYNTGNVSAYERGGNLSALTLAQLNALGAGNITIIVDGYSRGNGSISLSAASSFSAAATTIQNALNAGNGGNISSFTGNITGTVLTVTGWSSGNIAVGQQVIGGNVTTGTWITGLGNGTGGNGTYNLSANISATGAESMQVQPANVTVTYDSTSSAFVITSGIYGNVSTVAYASGNLATSLDLTAATGAVLSQGASAQTANTTASFMTGITTLTQNWATFKLLFDPDSGAEPPTGKLAFAAWTSTQSNRYMYVAVDTDILPTESTAATGSFGYIVTQTDDYSGTCPIYEPSTGGPYYGGAFVCGYAASIDFTQTNGRATLAFKTQSGLAPGVTSATVASNLQANGYNYMGAYATGNNSWTFMYPGSISGPFDWVDTYLNQIWLNNQLQVALVNLLTNVNSIPYNAAGYSLIESACLGPLAAALNAGVIRAGVALSALQIAEINNAAGANIANTVQTQGWYLQIQPASSATRVARQSPPMTLWYVDGESVQKLSLASIVVQ